MNTENTSESTNGTIKNKFKDRKFLLRIFGIVLLAIVFIYLLYYVLIGRYHETTNDAYVNGNIIQITPQTVGTVTGVLVNDTEYVTTGMPLVQLDPSDAKVTLEKAEANLAQTVRQVSQLFSGNHSLAEQIRLRKVELKKAQDDYSRRQKIASTGGISREELAHARDARNAAQVALTIAEQTLEQNEDLTRNTQISTHPNVLAAAAQVRDAYLNYARTTIPAPIDGYVAKRTIQVGQHIMPGTPLMAIVPLNNIWVDANFKEEQIGHMRIGQPVVMTADLYGSSIEFHGKIIGFSAGTGAAFSLLPAQNATGNWIKVVQRLPVRITLNPEDLKRYPLRIGLSMTVDVDTKTQQGKQLSNVMPLKVNQTDVFQKYGEQADQEIAKIIADNSQASQQQQPQASPHELP